MSVGSPMPRLMICPSLSSWPARAAMTFFASLAIELLLPDRAVLDVRPNHRVHEDARGVDGVRIELAHRVEVLDLGDDEVCTCGGGHVEIAGRAPVDQVAPRVSRVR